MRKTYIVPASNVRSFQHDLVKNNDVLMGVQVLPFEACCLESPLTSKQIEIHCFEAIQNNSFSLLELSLKSPSLIKDLINFRIDMKCYDLDLSCLPQTTQREKELYHAFSIIEPYIPSLSLPPGTIYYSLEGLSHAQIAFLSKSNALPLSPSQKSPSKLEAFEALNFRQELEGAMQYILSHHFDNAVIALFNYESVIPYVESCFQRYGVNVSYQNRLFDIVKHQMLAFIKQYTSQDLASTLALIESGALGLKKSYKLLRYIHHYKLHLNQLVEPFNYALDTKMSIVRDIIDLQKEIQDDAQILRHYLLEIQEMSLNDFIVYALNRLSELHPFDTKPLLRYVQEVYPFITRDSLPVVIKHIQALKDNPKQSLSIQVVDVNAIPSQIDVPLIILGLSSKAYPNLSSLSGVLDESYVKQIKGFPTLEARNKFNLELKRSIFRKADHLVLSFPHATYEGKALEGAYDAEVLLSQYNIKPKPWSIQEALNGLKPSLKLDPMLARALYERDGKIVGSVSSLELYVQDPLQHFIKHGLRLQEPPSYKLDERLFGTLNHSYFERSLNGKNTNLWDDYASYLPLDDATLSLVREINDEVLQFHHDNLSQAIQTTSFKPTYFETRFENESFFEGFEFNGVIDRIDVADDHLLIVDYKSSNHVLQSNEILLGHQLQLLTYALMARLRYNMPIQGVFYYSLNKNTITQNGPSYSKTKGISSSNPVTIQDLQKAHSYKGWFFDEPDDRFTQADFYTGLMLRKKDDSFYIFGKPYDIEKVKVYFVALYDYLKQQLLNGELDVNKFNLPLFDNYSFKQGGDEDES